MKFKILSTLLVLSMSLAGMAATVTIKGNAESYAGQRVVIQKVLNFLSFEKQTLAENFVSDDGIFTFQIDVDKTSKLEVHIEGVYADLFVVPGETYKFKFPELPFNKVRRLFDNQVALEFDRNEGRRNINIAIAEYDNLLDTYSSNVAIDLSYRYTRSPKGYIKNRPQLKGAGLVNEDRIDSLVVASDIDKIMSGFEGKIETVFGDVDNAFLADYIKYGKAALFLSSGADKWDVYFDYLHQQPVLYDHPEYMRFARALYGNVFEQARAEQKYSVVRTVNSNRDPDLLIKELENLRYMDDANIRKLVSLINLQEVYTLKEWSSKGINQLLEAAVNSPEWAEEKGLVESLLRRINFGSKGQEVGKFRMLDAQQEWVQSSDWDGKYVYINFFASWCADCIQEMQLMQKLHVKYQRDVAFVSISLDDNFESFKAFYLGHPEFDWEFVYGPSFKDFRETFLVSSLPEFILIDPSGRIVNDYTRKPSEGVNITFEQLMARSRKDNRIKVWDD